MERIDSIINKALKAEQLTTRAHGSCGGWLAFLLPLAVATSNRGPGSALVGYSHHLLLSLLNLFFVFLSQHSFVLNTLKVIPPMVGIYLYRVHWDLDFKTSLLYTVWNSFIYSRVFHYLLKVFPKTFTFGEANVAVQGLFLFIHSSFFTLYYKPSVINEYDMCKNILIIALSWILTFCAVPYYIPPIRKTVPMCIWGTVILSLIYLTIFRVLECHLVVWMLEFLFKPQRRNILIVWLICFASAVVVVQNQINKWKKSSTVLRKFFHVLAVIVFLSGVLLDFNLIYFSSGCVFGLFLVLEVFRIGDLPLLSEFLRGGFSVYSDEKDSGVLALTPLCLLAGLALPLWLHPSNGSPGDSHLQLLSGVLSVGIGDTFASVGGKYFGKHKWKGSNKTIEGTVFCILSQMIFIQVLVFFGFFQSVRVNFMKTFAAVFITSIVEAKTDQIDNIVLPLTMYIILMT